MAVRFRTVVEALQLKEGDDIEIHIAGERVFELEKKPSPQELLARLSKYWGVCPPTSSSAAWKLMKTDRPFFDTNVLLYLLSEDHRKADQAEAIIALGGFISVQALNKFASVASMSYAEIRDMLGTVRAVSQTQALTVDTHDQGLDIAERFGFFLYDSMIASSVFNQAVAFCLRRYAAWSRDR